MKREAVHADASLTQVGERQMSNAEADWCLFVARSALSLALQAAWMPRWMERLRVRSRGRSPMRWADQIKAAVAVPLHECARKAAAREEWRRIVKRATTLK
ncbi:jg4552 [Pararge aegeria aegeria]|uniref:Jg4552 protein n=1 Tax=Pararge aegeria aegeria TaxID=348720 RepID=A0A8S4RNT6_9NEOP|nr:jg4552 [Pararge aegeria aegeria]